VLGAERLCRVSWADLFCGAHHYLDLAKSVEHLNGHDRQPIDYISLGCPHYHIDGVRRIAEFLDGRRIHPDTLLHAWTAGPFKYMADRCGYTRTIEKAAS